VTRISAAPAATSRCPARGSVLTTTGGALPTVNSSAVAAKPPTGSSSAANRAVFRA
jgi:hypothetical protein